MRMQVKSSRKLARQANWTGATSDATLLSLWLNGKSKATQKTYAAIAGRFLGYIGKPLSEVTLIDLQFYGDYLQGLGLHPNSIRLHQMALKSLLAFGARTGYLRFDVGRAWKSVGVPCDIAKRILTEKEALQLTQAPKRYRDRVLLELLYKTGMRVSELASLTWESVRELETGGAVISIHGKGNKLRYVLIPSDLLQALRKLNPKQTGAVFVSQKGKPLSVRQIQLLCKAVGLRALGKPITPHWLRHCMATHCLRRGMPVTDVASVLGHSNIAITSRYLHANPNVCPSDYLPS